jgi:tetratricopeptide (TPR) repeat protein
MVAVAAAVRINNALTYHPLQGYDAFGHFTYIWYMAETWRVPLSTAGWSFFHPPLYYVVMALFWKGLSGVDPFLRLRIGTAFMGLLSLTHAWVCYLIVRRYFPGDRLIHLLAVGLMLFVPVHLYGGAFLGNEGFGAVFCSLSILALLAALERPSASCGAVLGLFLGLAMLTKFTAFPVMIGALSALTLQSLHRRTILVGVRMIGACTLVILAVCGWYYARNISLYGTPFKLSRDAFIVRHVEDFQTNGTRTLLEYITFDPLILLEPQFPRGLPLVGEVPAGAVRGPIRESVWTGIYANAWFDGFGGWVLPAIVFNEGALFAGRVLLGLGLVPTMLILCGGVTAVVSLWRRGWDDTLVAMLIIAGAMVLSFVYGTHIVKGHHAIKATYFMPITVVFSFFFALGLKTLANAKPTLLPFVAVEAVLLAAASALVFTQGIIFERDFSGLWTFELRNQEGIVYYAGGDRSTAKRLFVSSARHRWHLAWENLATLDFEAGQPEKALRLLSGAAELIEKQTFGTKEDKEYLINATRAEYLNSQAVILHAMGSLDQALTAANTAVSLTPDFPELYYNLGVLTLLRAMNDDLEGNNLEAKRQLIRDASEQLATAVRLDPGFVPAAAILGVSKALLGECSAALPALRWALAPPAGTRREFPVETGRGDVHSASIGRRKIIAELPEELHAAYRLRLCEGAVPRSARAR